MRVAFCGALNGSVVVRKGETEEQAIARAELQINDLFMRHAKSLSLISAYDVPEDPKYGPNCGLEPDNSEVSR